MGVTCKHPEGGRWSGMGAGAFPGDGAQRATRTTDLAKVDPELASHLCSNLKLPCLPVSSLQHFNLPYWYDMRKKVERQPAPGALSL